MSVVPKRRKEFYEFGLLVKPSESSTLAIIKELKADLQAQKLKLSVANIFS